MEKSDNALSAHSSSGSFATGLACSVSHKDEGRTAVRARTFAGGPLVVFSMHTAPLGMISSAAIDG